MGGCCCNCGPHYELRVHVERAEGFSDKYDFFGSIDAFIKVEYDGTTKKTKVIKNNTQPVWNEVLVFDGKKVGKELELAAWDWDRLSPNDFAGKAVIPLKDMPTQYNTNKEFTLTLKNSKAKDTCKLHVKVEFTQT
eukprot:UN06808